MFDLASSLNLIKVKDLTKYELSNPIMDTRYGVSYKEVGEYRNSASKLFWTKERWQKITELLRLRGLPNNINPISLQNWTAETLQHNILSKPLIE